MCKVTLLCFYNMLYNMLNEFQLKKDFSHMILSDRVQDKMSSFDTWVPDIKHFYWTMSNVRQLFRSLPQNRKHLSLTQNVWYVDKIKSFRKLMICFCHFCKKICLFWVWPTLTPFLCKLGPKMAILRGFSMTFSELLDYN